MVSLETGCSGCRPNSCEQHDRGEGEKPRIVFMLGVNVSKDGLLSCLVFSLITYGHMLKSRRGGFPYFSWSL